LDEAVPLSFVPGPSPDEVDSLNRPKAIRVPAEGTVLLLPREVRGAAAIRRVDVSFPYGSSAAIGAPRAIERPESLRGLTAYPLPIAPVARWCVGLLRLDVTMSNDSQAVLWIEIVGRSPFLTVAGVVAMLLGFGGLLSIQFVLRKGYDEDSAAWWELVGLSSVFLGSCTAIALQEFGVFPLHLLTILLLSVPGFVLTLILLIVIAIVERWVSPETPTDDVREWRTSWRILIREVWRTSWTKVGSVVDPIIEEVRWFRGRLKDIEWPTLTSRAVDQPKPVPPIPLAVELECRRLVPAGESFVLLVQLPPDSRAGREAQELKPTVTVQLIAPDFELAEEGLWTRHAEVAGNDPERSIALAEYRIKSTDLEAETVVQVRGVQTLLSVHGQMLGVLERPIGVLATHQHLQKYNETPSAERTSELETVAAAEKVVTETIKKGAHRGAFLVPRESSEEQADLSVFITRVRGQAEGSLYWAFKTPHPIRVPDGPLYRNIGSDARSFARALVNKFKLNERAVGRNAFFLGLSKQVGAVVPLEFWDLLRGIGGATGERAPRVLLVTEDPYVPWELAYMPGRLLYADRGEFLGAQAVVGRWLINANQLDGGGSVAPVLREDIPKAHNVTRSLFIFGDYQGNGRPLPQAEPEATSLARTLRGIKFKATLAEVMRELQTSRADLIHFAVHGKYDPNGYEDGLVMSDGSMLDPWRIAGLKLPKGVFVFLNACEVGSGEEILGLPSGTVHAFFEAGASAVVAPLWSIGDKVSSTIAQQFYDEVIRVKSRKSPAAVLRDIRREFKTTKQVDGEPSLTYVAYMFFGHPDYALTFSHLSRVPDWPRNGQHSLRGLSR
jgi:hypothetical protein